jgi:uncharacterized protein
MTDWQRNPPPAFHVMAKPRGAVCNLDCQYCFYLSKEALFPGSQFRMSDELLEVYTRQYIASQRVPEVTFTWQGGEPALMGLDFYRKAVAFQQQYRPPGVTIHNALQTNATTLDEDWAQFFREHNFLIGVSLDGPRELHDAYRVDKGGKPTFERVMAGIELLKKHRVEFNILACVNALTAKHPIEVYRFLRDDVGAQYLQFIPIVEREPSAGMQVSARVSRISVTGRRYGQFLIEIFDEWVRRDVGKVFVQLFDVALGVWHGMPAGLCIFSETCGLALALEHTGDLFACDHFVEPRDYLGNIQGNNMLELVTSEQQQQFGLDKRQTLPRYCRECQVRFICNGGCPKDRLLRTPDGEPGLNYLCEGYKAFFTHIDRPMRLMSALLKMQRAPAEIMRITAEEANPAPNMITPGMKTKRRRRGKL